jgi:hypothetical protein
MGLRSGGDVVMVVGSCGGGGGGHTSDLVTGGPRSTSLASDLGDRVLVGLPLGLTQILAICLGAGLSGESSTSMTSTGSSSSSSSVTVIHSSPSSPPSLRLGDDNTIRLAATR